MFLWGHGKKNTAFKIQRGTLFHIMYVVFYALPIPPVDSSLLNR